jgi:hypothetical protein
VVDAVNDITASRIACATIATQRNDRARLERHRWANEAFHAPA